MQFFAYEYTTMENFVFSLFWLSLHECIHFLKSVLEKKMRYGKVDSVLAVAKQEFTMYAGYSI